MDNIQHPGPDQPQYFQVSSLKFILMSACSFGLYEIYWTYKNWQFIKQRDQSKIWPFWRAVFAPIWYYSLLDDLAKHSGSESISSGTVKASLAVMYFLLSAAWKLPDPYWLIMYLTVIPVLPAVRVITRLNSSRSIRQRSASHSVANFATYFLGGPIFIFLVLSSINYLPSTMVTDGSLLWNKDYNFLKAEGLLGQGDRILYFYSSGLLSIQDDGQFITETNVISYYRDLEDSELYVGKLLYEEIEDVSVVWAETFLDDTVVTITDFDENQFELWISSESGGDKIFVDELMKRWKSK